PTPLASAELTVSGDHVDFYRYQLNNGSWSEEQPVIETIDLTGLSGEVNVSVLGRSIYGGYLPESEALTVSWKVDPAAPGFTVGGVPVTPTSAQTATLMVSSPEADLYRWTIDAGYYRAEAPLTEPIELQDLKAGLRTVGLI